MHSTLTLADLPDRQRTWFGPKPAVVTPDRQWTFREVAEEVAWCRDWLTAEGIGKGDRVVTIFPQSPAFIPWFFAIAGVGAISVPINLRLAPPEVDRIILDADPELVLVDVDEQRWLDDLDVAGWPSTCRAVVAPPSGRAGGVVQPGSLDPEDPVTILYTSGTTGEPKGCVMSHRSLVAAAMNMFYGMGLRWHDRYLATLPMFHVGGLAFMASMFHAGATTVIAGTADPDDMLDQLVAHDITFVSVPFLGALLDRAEARGVRPPSLRLVGWGSQMERSDTLRRIRSVLGCEWRGMFGGTETGNVGLITYLEDELEHPGTIGRPMPGLLVSVRDVATGEEVPHGEPGELCVRGPSTFTEYWRKPDATRETIRDGWVRTGDLVRYDPTGLLFFEGRAKDMIKSGGENVFAVEVEKVILAVPGVRDAAVFGVPDAKWGELVCAAVVLDEGATLAEEDLSRHLRRELAGYKVPKRWHVVDEIPRILGKAVKKQLRDRFA